MAGSHGTYEGRAHPHQTRRPESSRFTGTPDIIPKSRSGATLAPPARGEQEDPRTGRALSDPNSYTRLEGIGEPQHLAEDPHLPAALRDRAAVEPVRVDAAALGRVQNAARLRRRGPHAVPPIWNIPLPRHSAALPDRNTSTTPRPHRHPLRRAMTVGGLVLTGDELAKHGAPAGGVLVDGWRA